MFRKRDLTPLVLATTFTWMSSGNTAPSARTARGLDVWVHAQPVAAGGEAVFLNLEAVGFPSVERMTELPGAEVLLEWDLESLVSPGERAPVSPPPGVTAKTDADGRLSTSIPMPKGTSKAVTLIVTLRAGERTRTREISVKREDSSELSMFLSESRVVPGGEVAVWAIWTEGLSRAPNANKTIEFSLLQSGMVQTRLTATTDASGAAMIRMPIPNDLEPGAQWTLEAHGKSDDGGPSKSAALTARRETPGKSAFTSSFDRQSAKPGERVPYRVRVSDASKQGVGDHPVWIWTGPKGTSPPADMQAFQKVATRVLSDGGGAITGEADAPRSVPLRGTDLLLEARTELEGQVRIAKATLAVHSETGSARVTPQGGELIGGIPQKITFELDAEDGSPLVGTFSIKADGLSEVITTNAFGEAEATWKVPEGVGAYRDAGPCPGGVAAQLTLRAIDLRDGQRPFDGALKDPEGLSICVPVRRDRTALLEPKRWVVKAGESLPVSVLGARGRRASILLSDESGRRATGGTSVASGALLELKVPADMRGRATLTAALPSPRGAAEVVSSSVLVVPPVLAEVRGTVTGGRPVPNGTVTVEASLGDGSAPLQGSVMAVVIDGLGGGSFGPLMSMDTRSSLCAVISADFERCDELIGPDPSFDAYRRAHLPSSTRVMPQNDPGANIESMDEVFKSVVRSLEGAVFQSAVQREKLPDVGRRVGGRYHWNPELMSLVTDAMSEPPTTPGGEPVLLEDLMQIDPQITYDNVGRRITRLKLFEVLSQIRSSRMGLDPDEPIFEDPNIFLRKLVREGSLSEGALLDPWGGTMSFVKAEREYVPFVSVRRGWTLQSPGPDGKTGTADDVRSPFERVLRSGSPYARAANEDELVDARWDMQVSDATVSNWSTTLLRSTGTALGDPAEGLGLGGVGFGGGGSSSHGYGSGVGRAVSRSNASGVVHVAPPRRTDAQGRVSFEIPLGSEETTWEIALVAFPDNAGPAVTTVSVPASLPLSSRVELSTQWTEGDTGQAVIQVRNRTAKPITATVGVEPLGSLKLSDKARSYEVTVPARGATFIRPWVVAHAPGGGALRVTTQSQGLSPDSLTYEVSVLPRGEPLRITRTAWVFGEADLSAGLERSPMRAMGPAELVLEQDSNGDLLSALHYLESSLATTPDELMSSAEAASLLRGYFRGAQGPKSTDAERAASILERNLARLPSRLDASNPLRNAYLRSAARLGGETTLVFPKADACPSDPSKLSIDRRASTLSVEPPAEAGAMQQCWTQYVADSANDALESQSPTVLAKAILALADRPQRRREFDLLYKELEEQVTLSDGGMISLPDRSSRADRALVYAALLMNRAQPNRARLVQWLLVQRDAHGGFGSLAATAGAVKALLSEPSKGQSRVSDVQVELDFGTSVRTVALGAGTLRVPVPADAKKVVVRAPSIVARLERTFLRPFEVQAEPSNSSVTMTVDWPSTMGCAATKDCLRRGHVANLAVTLRSSLPSANVAARVPLPPGVALADDVAGVTQLADSLHLRTSLLGTSKALLIPLRFNTVGTFSLREATARNFDDQTEYDRTQASTLVVTE